MRAPGTGFFEGAEKKFELTIDPALPSLRSLGQAWWEEVSSVAGARILSGISNAYCDAYLLSESSLFVFDHKVVMITCGRTRLPAAALAVLDRVPPERVEMFVYERKNEAFPHNQPTSFFDDVELLASRLPGKAYQFGDEDEHYLYLFQLERPMAFDAPDLTLEILMYGIASDALPLFRAAPGAMQGEVRRRAGLDRILPGFEYDEHVFQPGGYSLNAIRSDQYLAIHVTPDEISSYASLETNYRFDDGELSDITRNVVQIFRPRSHDLIVWTHGDRALNVDEHGYRLKAHVAQELTCGYKVHFLNFYRPQTRTRRATELPLVRPELS